MAAAADRHHRRGVNLDLENGMTRTAIRGISLVGYLVVAFAIAAHAQTGTRQQATRAELQAIAQQLATSRDSASPALLAMVQGRLRDGDFREGDRIYLRVVEEPTLTDSFTVRTGRQLILPNVPAISLAGVLRSELEDHLRTAIAQVIRSPQVSATSFIRIAVLGGVVRPGFYQAPAETPIDQVLMLAGGLAPDARIEKSTVRRENAVVADAMGTRRLLAAGASLDQANLRAGDELLIGKRSTGGGLTTALTILSALAGVATAVFFVTQ